MFGIKIGKKGEIGQEQQPQDREFQNKEQSIQVTLRVTARGFYETGVSLYKEELSFVREIVQNALDANAKRLSINVSPSTLEFWDDGMGMSRDFLTNDFQKLGLAFKSEETDRGRYGFGRLSYWKPLAKEDRLGGIEYIGRIEIQSGDTIVNWNEIDKYTIGTAQKPIKGTKITFKSLEGNSLGISDKEIENYLNGLLVGNANIEIELNGKPVNAVLSVSRTYEGVKTAWLHKEFKDLEYEVGVSGNYNKLILAEKGIRIKVIDLPFNLGGYINVKPKGNETVTVLSREDSVLDNLWISCAYKDEFLKFLKEMSKSQLLDKRKEIISAANWFVNLYAGKFEDFHDVIMVNFKEQLLSISELKKLASDKRLKIVWALPNTQKELLDRAAELGYSVVVLDYDLVPFFRGVFACLNEADLSKQYLVNKDDSQATQIALDFLKGHMPDINDALKQVTAIYIRSDSKETEKEEVGEISYVGSKTLSSTTPNINDEVKILSEGAEVELYGLGKVPVYFGRIEGNTSTLAFTYNNKICFNTNSPEIQEILSKGQEDKRYLLSLVGPFLHEIVHAMGYHDHDENFASVLTLLYTKFLETIAGKSVEESQAVQK